MFKHFFVILASFQPFLLFQLLDAFFGWISKRKMFRIISVGDNKIQFFKEIFMIFLGVIRHDELNKFGPNLKVCVLGLVVALWWLIDLPSDRDDFI